jgi:hypothetical protein
MTDPWSMLKKKETILRTNSIVRPSIDPVDSCNGECPHKHEVVRLKQRLQDSIKDTSRFMTESQTLVSDMRTQYESSSRLLEMEVKALQDKICLLEQKNKELHTINTVELNELDNKLVDTEKKIADIEKKEPVLKEDVFTRLSKGGKAKVSTIKR